VATVSLLPGGVGPFEAGSVAALRLLGVSLEVSVAATLLVRGYTLWLPMLPGLWLARREMARGTGWSARPEVRARDEAGSIARGHP